MSHRVFSSLVTAGLTTILVACTMQSPPPPPPAPPADVPAGTAAPVSTELAAVSSTSAAPRPVPPMEVGSTFRHWDGSLLVAVPGGPFIMGGSGPDDPARTVTVDDFWAHSIEVTNRMYALCVKMEKCTPPDAQDNPYFVDAREGNRPVVGVTWAQSDEYCTFVGGRLLYEAEWEKMARGPEGNPFPWGPEPPACDLLNFDGCVRHTVFVGQYPDGESYYKAMDMSGNVFEWVFDWFLKDYYATAPTENPTGPAAGTERSVRSSAFNTDGFLTDPARRFSEKPDSHRADLGFRCVIEDPFAYAPFCTQLIAYGKDAGTGSGSGDTLTDKCQTPILDQLQLSCTQTNVWVDSNGGEISSSIGLEGCLDGGLQMHDGLEQHLYTCSPGTPPIQVCGSCVYPEPEGGPTCDPGFHVDGLQCVVDQGTPGICPPGSEYDEAMMCCSVTTGSGSSYDQCPPPLSYIPGDGPDEPGSCVEYVAGGIRCAAEIVGFRTGCGGDQPNCEDHPEDPACGGNDGPCPPGETYYCPAPNQCYCQ